MATVHAVAAEDRYSGTWLNVDAKDGGITKLVLAENDSGTTIHAWGKCHPDDCDWGEAKLIVSGYNTSQRLAVWDRGFVMRYMIVRPENDELTVEYYSVFKDDSG